MGITDVQLSLTSLEEVFLNIAKQVRRRGGRGYNPAELWKG
jgi:hypothetical protein